MNKNEKYNKKIVLCALDTHLQAIVIALCLDRAVIVGIILSSLTVPSADGSELW